MVLERKTYELKDGNEVTLRSPELGDEAALIDLVQSADCETKFLAREPGEFNMTLEQERDFINRARESEDRLFLIAEIEGQVVGNCSAGLVMANKRFSHRANMGILVREAHWGKGIGSFMMNEVVAWCKAKGVEQLELDVVTTNQRGIALYEKMGFEVFGTMKHAMKYPDGSYSDEYHMILFL